MTQETENLEKTHKRLGKLIAMLKQFEAAIDDIHNIEIYTEASMHDFDIALRILASEREEIKAIILLSLENSRETCLRDIERAIKFASNSEKILFLEHLQITTNEVQNE